MKCLSNTCNHTWSETTKQQESEKVFCPKCGAYHHNHSKPIKPPQPLKVKDKDPPPPRTPSYPINPPKKKQVLQKDITGKTVRIETVYETEEKEK